MSIPTPKNNLDFQHIHARIKDVGGIPVARVLPTKQRRLIGAWCFLDHAGPTVFKGDSAGMRVAPHPHTALQTFTWMLEGEILHRDSLGYEQVIRPGQVNLMTAGKGISHSEDTYGENRHLHAVQLWIALPEAVKDMPLALIITLFYPNGQLEISNINYSLGSMILIKPPHYRFLLY